MPTSSERQRPQGYISSWSQCQRGYLPQLQMHVSLTSLYSCRLQTYVDYNYLRWANVTLGLPCMVENTAYISYGINDEYIDITSR